MELERGRELLAMASFAEQLPLTFENGNQVTHLGTYCLGCDQALSAHEIHGEFRRLLPRVVQVEAVGYCGACNLLTPLLYRLDDQLVIVVEKDGRWTRFEPRPASFLARIRRALRPLWP